MKTLHNALYDAYITAQIFQRQLARLKRLGVKTLGGLLWVSKKGGEETIS